MQNIEIEIKLRIDNPQSLMNWLKENAQLIKTTKQEDIYFDPPHKSFKYDNKDGTIDADEWFRVRHSDKGHEVCYKLWHRDKETGRSLYADEIETTVENPKQMLEILQRLGFQETSTIKKHRESYKYKEFQFDCDQVEGLGFFLEIEFKGEAENPAAGREKIVALLKSTGITNWQKMKRGYSWIQWNPDKNHAEEGL